MNLKVRYDNIYQRSRRNEIAKFYRINQYIQAPKLRIIDAEGNQLGILERQVALKKAADVGLDLIEVSSNADPPVARILDYKKFKYDEGKKERGARKGISESGLKELWLSPRIEQHDLMVRINKAQDFLNDGHKVKLTVKFKGREMAHPENGHQVLKKVLEHFNDKISIDREVKFEGRNLSVIIGKARGNKPNETENTQSN